MALVKVKPTSAGRRGMVKVVSPNLHKGEPYAPLLERRPVVRAVTTTVTSRSATVAAVTSNTTVSSTSVATRMASPRRSSVWNTTRTVRRTSLCCATPTASVATSSLRAAWKWAPR